MDKHPEDIYRHKRAEASRLRPLVPTFCFKVLLLSFLLCLSVKAQATPNLPEGEEPQPTEGQAVIGQATEGQTTTPSHLGRHGGIATSLPEGEGRGEAAKAPSRPLEVHASLVVITPGDPIYSVFGHSAIRMECPTYGLDYCFSFESEPTLDYYLRFFAGKANAAFVAVPTKEFLSTYKEKGRGVTQYELNLTLHEKQELWRALDNDMVDGAHRKFNLLKNNCAAMVLTKIESILFNEQLDFGRMPEQMYYKNGDYLKWNVQGYSWALFLFSSFVGTEADTDWTYEQKLSPELVVPVLKGATIVNHADGSRRLVLIGQTKQLLPVTHVPQASKLTPTIAFLLLLLFAIAITIAQWRGKWSRAAHVFDTVLFVLQTLIGLFLVYVTAVAGLFGYHWNWLLIPFNPLPFILWLCLRKRPIYNKVWPLYTLVLVAFIVIVPWVTIQLQPAHYLIVATMAVRCAAHVKRDKSKQVKK